MLEPISASFGIAGFGFSLFANCIKGFLLLSSAKNLSKDASTLRCMLHLEEYRLVQWAEKAGLLSKSEDGVGCGELNERLNKGLIEETLTELGVLLTDVDALKRRYNLVVTAEKPPKGASSVVENGAGGGGYGGGLAPPPEYSTHAPIVEAPPTGNRGVFAQAVHPKKRNAILQRAKLLSADASNLPKRLWWVLAEKEDFERLIRQIGFFVQRLVDLLDDQQREGMMNDIRVLLLNVVAMNDRLDELKAIKTSVELVVGPNSPIASSAAVKCLRMELEDDQSPPLYLGKGGNGLGAGLKSPPMAPPAYSRSPSPGSSRASTLRHEIDGPLSPRLTPTHPPPINYRKRNPLPTIYPNLITNKSGNGPRPTRETATYNPTDAPPCPIYIEWKSINKPLRSKIRPRVENLAHLLHTPKHPSFRTLHCLGFFEDYEKCQYGFVFQRPPTPYSDPSKNPISLLQLFRLKGFQLPSQTLRMKLACTLAAALSQLHSAGWLHKSLRADNILFFPTLQGGGGDGNKYNVDLTSPYLVGYEYARFDATSEVSEQPSSNPEHDIYRHPLAIGDYSESFNRIFDIYSLGLIFLEIANWRPLRRVVAPLIGSGSGSGGGGGGSSSTMSRSSSSSTVSSAGGKTKKSSRLAGEGGGGGGRGSSLSVALAASSVENGSNSGSTTATTHVPLSQIMKIKSWLLDPTSEENVPGNLAFLMGDIYAGVVQRCLKGDLLLESEWLEDGDEGYDGGEGRDADDDHERRRHRDEMERDPGGEWMLGVEGARISEGFFVKVVRELERCVV